MNKELCLIAIETTGAACSVALQYPTDSGSVDLYEHTRIAPRQHNALILEMTESLFYSSGVTAKDLDAIAFSAGPGSFTGVRIGAAVAQGIALGLNLPVIRIPTSELMAEQIRRRCSAGGVVTVRPSRKGWIYVARYRFIEGGVECESFDRLTPDEAQLDVPNGWLLARREERLQAKVLAEICDTEQLDDAAMAIPYYVEGDSPWKKTI